MSLREPKERPQRSQEIIVTTRRQFQAIEEPRYIVWHERAYVAMEAFFEHAESVAQIAEVNIAHAFCRFPGDHLVYGGSHGFALNAAPVMSRVETHCIQ